MFLRFNPWAAPNVFASHRSKSEPIDIATLGGHSVRAFSADLHVDSKWQEAAMARDRRTVPADSVSVSRRSFLSGSLALLGSTLLPPTSAPAATGASELDFASALTAARAIRRGDVSSVELTTRVLERIKQFNPKINAIVTLTADAALARARAADEALARGEWWGPFHGVPCTIKDTFETAGVRTTAGAPSLANHVSTVDAAVVSRLRAAGVVILGKTNVPLMARDVQSYNDIFGTTSNPWDVSRTPGGSSGGEAAALAAGLSYLGVGSDIGGSIRTPAHFCGVYGHKPTLNLVPFRGHIPPLPGGPPLPPSDLAVVGPMARAAGDLRAALEVLGGPDGDEARAYRWSLPPARGARLSDYRIGFVLDDPACPVSPDVGEVLAQAVKALRRAGAKLDEGWPVSFQPPVNPAGQYETYLYLVNATFAFFLPDDRVEQARQLAARQDGSIQTKRAQAWTAPHKSFQAATRRRMAARAAWQDYFRTHDAFLMPTAFVPAFPHDYSVPAPRPLVGPLDERVIATPKGSRSYLDMLFWVSFATVTGLPATTAPVGLTRSGLPVGIQIIGPYLEDATPIDLAGRLADVTGGFRPPKGF
jgi:amidase